MTSLLLRESLGSTCSCMHAAACIQLHAFGLLYFQECAMEEDQGGAQRGPQPLAISHLLLGGLSSFFPAALLAPMLAAAEA